MPAQQVKSTHDFVESNYDAETNHLLHTALSITITDDAYAQIDYELEV